MMFFPIVGGSAALCILLLALLQAERMLRYDRKNRRTKEAIDRIRQRAEKGENFSEDNEQGIVK